MLAFTSLLRCFRNAHTHKLCQHNTHSWALYKGISQHKQLPFASVRLNHTASNVQQSSLSASRSVKEKDSKYLDDTFEDVTEAYRSKTTKELMRALFVFQLTSIDTLVTHNAKLLKLLQRILGKRLFLTVMKATFYGQFLGGSSVEEATSVLARNNEYGVRSILDGSIELEQDMSASKLGSKTEDISQNPTKKYVYDSEALCDSNMWAFMKCVDIVSDSTNGTGCAAIKLTALARPQLLSEMTTKLAAMKDVFNSLTSEQTSLISKRIKVESLCMELSQHNKDELEDLFTSLDVHETGEIDIHTWTNMLTNHNSRFLLTHFKLPYLTSNQLSELNNVIQRVSRIVEHAAERDVQIIVDGEQTYFQPFISWLTVEMMRKYNKQRIVVINTYQCYLKNAYDNVVTEMDLAKREDFCFGCKAVRGAYMEQERQRAASVGYDDPINDSYEATNEMYERVMDVVMVEAANRSKGKVNLMTATHNEDSIKYCLRRLKELGLRKEDGVVSFAQLLGMCDRISFPLGQNGYPVYKYLPFGPIERVMPFLSRRAADNRGVLVKVQKEKKMLWKEIKRRVFSSRS